MVPVADGHRAPCLLEIESTKRLLPVAPEVPIGATSAVAETVVLARRSVLNLTE
jgi:hypothetical protein